MRCHKPRHHNDATSPGTTVTQHILGVFLFCNVHIASNLNTSGRTLGRSHSSARAETPQAMSSSPLLACCLQHTAGDYVTELLYKHQAKASTRLRVCTDVVGFLVEDIQEQFYYREYARMQLFFFEVWGEAFHLPWPTRTSDAGH